MGKPKPTHLTALDAARGLRGTVYFAEGGRIWRLRGGRLTALTPDGSRYAYPAVTPDGTTTAAALLASGQSVIAIGGQDFAGLSLTHPLARNPHDSGSLDLKPAFSPDGRRLAFMSDRARGYADEAIWEGPLNVRARQATFPPDSTGGDDAPAYASDAHTLVYVAWRDNHGGLSAVTVPGGRSRALVKPTDHDVMDPAPGPGDQLAYTQRQGEAENVFVGASDGTGGHPITSFNDCRQPAWSPDGKQVLFISPHAGSFDLWVVPASGGPPAQLTSGGDLDANSRPAWINA